MTYLWPRRGGWFLNMKNSLQYTTRHYNSLIYGIYDILFRRLQAVQNAAAAARLVTGTRKCDHITLVLQQLHWLSVRQRVKFKLSILAYKVLNNLASTTVGLYDCQLVACTRRRQHRLSDNFKSTITGTSSRLGDRAFAAAGPRLWNSLLTHIRRLDLSLDTFRSANWKRI